VRMVEFAIEHGLESVDFGSILNTTKQRMNEQGREHELLPPEQETPLLRAFFGGLMRLSKAQGQEQMQFRSGSEG